MSIVRFLESTCKRNAATFAKTGDKLAKTGEKRRNNSAILVLQCTTVHMWNMRRDEGVIDGEKMRDKIRKFDDMGNLPDYVDNRLRRGTWGR